MAIISEASEGHSAGDPLPPKCAVIQVHVAELNQLFNSIDPSPFRNKDLDPKAEEFIVGWAKDVPRDTPLGLMVELGRSAGLPDEAAVLRDAIHKFFFQRAQAFRQRLRELFRVGRTSLVIGLVVLVSAIALGDFLASLLNGNRIGEILRESLTIGGWVSMWRPLEVFLYDWWPIRNEAQLSDRLAAMPVRVRYLNKAPSETWKSDWPVVTQSNEPGKQEPDRNSSSSGGIIGLKAKNLLGDHFFSDFGRFNRSNRSKILSIPLRSLIEPKPAVVVCRCAIEGNWTARC